MERMDANAPRIEVENIENEGKPTENEENVKAEEDWEDENTYTIATNIHPISEDKNEKEVIRVTIKEENDIKQPQSQTVSFATRPIAQESPTKSSTLSYAPTTVRYSVETNAEDVGTMADLGDWTYKRVEDFLDSEYNSDYSNKSVICDIIAMYLKGQKILYTEAKTVCEQRMNYLMLPAIFITSACTILSLVLKEYSYGSTIVSSLNGFNAFLLALISYLKLDAKAEGHRTSAYKFDKMQSELEFSSGKAMFMDLGWQDMVKIINDTEASVKEIKETNKFILPEDIRMKYPQLCNMNVFAEVKKVQNAEMIKANQLKDAMNAIRKIERLDRVLTEDEKDDLADLKEQERKLILDIISLKDDYLQIDDLFEEEMKVQRDRIRRSCQIFGWLKT